MVSRKTGSAASEVYNPDAESSEVRSERPRANAAAKPAARPKPRHEALAVQAGEGAITADAGIIENNDVLLRKDIERIRGMRRPFGAFTQKLALAERRGYHRHWFADEPGRVDGAQANGWTPVKDKEGKPVRRVAGRARDGGPLYLYAMEIPKVFWEEDMQARFDAASARIAEIKKNPFRAKPGQAQKSDEGKFYSAEDEPLRVQEPSA